MFIFGIFVEVETQYIWGLSFSYKKAGQGNKAGWLKAACIGYVMVGMLLAVVFFSLEIDKKEVVAKTIKQSQTNRQTKIDQYNNQISYYQKQASNETDRRGPKAIEIEGLIKQTISDRDTLENAPVDIDSSTTETPGNVFKSLGEILKPFGLTEGILKLIIFGYCVLMIYLGVMLTYWSVELNDVPNETPETPEKTEMETLETDIVTPVTPDETPLVTAETPRNGKAVCPTCGKHFPFKRDKTFCSANCRVTAHRHQEREAS